MNVVHIQQRPPIETRGVRSITNNRKITFLAPNSVLRLILPMQMLAFHTLRYSKTKHRGISLLKINNNIHVKCRMQVIYTLGKTWRCWSPTIITYSPIKAVVPINGQSLLK